MGPGAAGRTSHEDGPVGEAGQGTVTGPGYPPRSRLSSGRAWKRCRFKRQLGWHRENPSPLGRGVFQFLGDKLRDSQRRKRILTGDRPTSDAFHLGNYVGTLANRVRLQDEYETFLLLADLHLLTTRTSDLEEVGHNIHELVLDYLSVGIDHNKTT